MAGVTADAILVEVTGKFSQYERDFDRLIQKTETGMAKLRRLTEKPVTVGVGGSKGGSSPIDKEAARTAAIIQREAAKTAAVKERLAAREAVNAEKAAQRKIVADEKAAQRAQAASERAAAVADRAVLEQSCYRDRAVLDQGNPRQ